MKKRAKIVLTHVIYVLVQKLINVMVAWQKNKKLVSFVLFVKMGGFIISLFWNVKNNAQMEHLKKFQKEFVLLAIQVVLHATGVWVANVFLVLQVTSNKVQIVSNALVHVQVVT